MIKGYQGSAEVVPKDKRLLRGRAAKRAHQSKKPTRAEDAPEKRSSQDS